MVLTDDVRLPSTAKAAIERATTAAVSAITFYEIGQKVRLGKWDEMAPFVQDLPNIVAEDGFTLIPLHASQALSAATLPWAHRDPFDRMIAAVAMAEAASLISSDVAFDELQDVTRIWA